MIEIIYRFNGEEFKEDDLIQVIKRDPFTEERTMITGRVVKSLINTELVLDISTRYNAKTCVSSILLWHCHNTDDGTEH